MNTLLQDIRFGLRMLLKSPSISIVATIALALGIGANTAIFSVVNAVLLRPLPFPNSDSLVSLFETKQAARRRSVVRTRIQTSSICDRRTLCSSASLRYHGSDFIMTGRGEPARLQGAVVTADLFPLLGVRADAWAARFCPKKTSLRKRARGDSQSGSCFNVASIPIRAF